MLDPKKIEIPSRDSYKLDNILRAAATVGDPQLGRRTILVAGTNGKGSVCAYLTALFRETGLKVGTYISPHLVTREERIRINAKPISSKLLLEYEEKFKSILEPLTYFERFTILTYLIFRDQKVDVQVIEVGMGGRLDATNICSPDLSVITPIDYDHQEVLGSTLTQIASEKAGVMREGKICFSAKQRPEASKALKQISGENKSILKVVSGGARVHSQAHLPGHKILTTLAKQSGVHQAENALLACTVFERARSDWAEFSKNWKKLETRGAHSKALRRALSPESLFDARIQILSRRPLMILDGSHNPHSVRALVTYLKRNYPKKKFHLIFGVMKDKDLKQIVRLLKSHVKSLSLPNFYPERQESAEVIAKAWPSKLPILHKGWAVSDILGHTPKTEILICGSLYLAGEVLKAGKSR